LSGEAVGMVVKRYVGWLGYDVEDFAGHSLRASLATSAAGKSERAIMNQTGHRSLPTVRRYIRDGNLFRDNAAHGLELRAVRQRASCDHGEHNDFKIPDEPLEESGRDHEPGELPEPTVECRAGLD
jgi:hypothetical protein